jgi:hypothetical protein
LINSLVEPKTRKARTNIFKISSSRKIFRSKPCFKRWT